MTKYLGNLCVDAVLCINLRERDDRRASLLRNFQDSGLKIEFFTVDKDKENPQRGCYNSHIACAKLMLERNYNRILILEDDAFIEPFSRGVVQRINHFLDKNDPELFYLGLSLGKIWLTWKRNIARCRGQGTHAYILSRKGCERILSWGQYCYGVAIDNLFAKRFKAYCVFPMICYQDIENLGSDVSFGIMKEETPRPHIPEHDLNGLFVQRKKQYISVIKNLHKTLLFR